MNTTTVKTQKLRQFGGDRSFGANVVRRYSNGRSDSWGLFFGATRDEAERRAVAWVRANGLASELTQ